MKRLVIQSVEWYPLCELRHEWTSLGLPDGDVRGLQMDLRSTWYSPESICALPNHFMHSVPASTFGFPAVPAPFAPRRLPRALGPRMRRCESPDVLPRNSWIGHPGSPRRFALYPPGRYHPDSICPPTQPKPHRANDCGRLAIISPINFPSIPLSSFPIRSASHSTGVPFSIDLCSQSLPEGWRPP